MRCNYYVRDEGNQEKYGLSSFPWNRIWNKSERRGCIREQQRPAEANFEAGNSPGALFSSAKTKKIIHRKVSHPSKPQAGRDFSNSAPALSP
jgi:hypothetical protein